MAFLCQSTKSDCKKVVLKHIPAKISKNIYATDCRVNIFLYLFVVFTNSISSPFKLFLQIQLVTILNLSGS